MKIIRENNTFIRQNGHYGDKSLKQSISLKI